MGLEIIFALGIASFLLLYFSLNYKSGNEGSSFDTIIRFMGFTFFFISLILLGKGAIDYKDNCTTFISNATIEGNTTLYEYDYNCVTNEYNTPLQFYDTMLWLFRIFMTIVVLYLCLHAINKLMELFKRRGVI